jgi:uncharacterized Rossmann fold enzyme
MKYRTWEPTYKEILKDFGLEQENDDRAAREASRIISHKGSNGKGTKETIKKKKLKWAKRLIGDVL